MAYVLFILMNSRPDMGLMSYISLDTHELRLERHLSAPPPVPEFTFRASGTWLATWREAYTTSLTFRRMFHRLSGDPRLDLEINGLTGRKTSAYRMRTDIKLTYDHRGRIVKLRAKVWLAHGGPQKRVQQLAHELAHLAEILDSGMSPRALVAAHPHLGYEGRKDHFETWYAVDIEEVVRREYKRGDRITRARLLNAERIYLDAHLLTRGDLARRDRFYEGVRGYLPIPLEIPMSFYANHF